MLDPNIETKVKTSYINKKIQMMNYIMQPITTLKGRNQTQPVISDQTNNKQ